MSFQSNADAIRKTRGAAQTRERGSPASLADLIATVRIWAQRTRSRAELAEMDDRTLRDLGLSPGQARFEASKPFWRA